MNKKLAVICGLALCAFAATPRPAHAEVISAPAGKFKVEVTVDLPASPNDVYDAVTGDISPWWDHSFHQRPKRLFIEAKPGGGFWEIFDDSGDGVLHARVNYAERGKILRYTGPLGFSGIAAEFVTTYQFSPAGTGTHFKVTAVAAGDVDEKTAAIVDQVWHHFLFDRLKPYIESGDYKKHVAATRDPHPGGTSAAQVSAASDDSSTKIGAFAWMAGNWTGKAGDAKIEFICTPPEIAQMECMFRAMDDKKVQQMEFISLQQTPRGLEERVEFKNGDFADDGPSRVTYKVERVSRDSAVFATADGSIHNTVTRSGENDMLSHIEITDANGKKNVIRRALDKIERVLKILTRDTFR